MIEIVFNNMLNALSHDNIKIMKKIFKKTINVKTFNVFIISISYKSILITPK